MSRRKAARADAAPAVAQRSDLTIRPVRRGDLEAVIAIGESATAAGTQFLVAESGGEVVGFIIGEVRDWEFGAPPCGWVFAIDVRPDARLAGIGTRLLESISAGFRRAGVRKVRTMLASDNTLILSFFRSQGMMAGRFIPLEMDLEG
jgi:GNAT superfamily N-acetyltransferase